ncbi:unnamed protein product [Rotaria socialis]|uniref:Methyltransferase type 11 domain-containing protein n=1 Tax=Rotaria socialis TaxID=392032 RepID=A0A821VLH8_9BILA|nr:unnamed protein product [Rotaria socialis]CAF3740624.1 unnamed protein product [Rotaria socialis]CAF4658434.1 unnamed protein product [Rotaria socialis]CAF4910803.1 unnamed protein product [Rotaria socialis]
MKIISGIYTEAWSRPEVGTLNDVCGPKSPYEEYYNVTYFKWQLKHQLFQASHSDPTRMGRIKPVYTVLEIGCSAGAVLSTIKCATKFCVEINSYARAYAEKIYNLTTFRCIAELSDNSVDYAYSVAVLEHVEAPLILLRQLYSKMRSGSTLEIQVKNEGRQSASNYSKQQNWSYKRHDLNNHLYTWTELLLGNMIQGAGFEIIRIVGSIGAFPPNYQELWSKVSAQRWANIVKEEGKKQGVETLTAFAKKK